MADGIKPEVVYRMPNKDGSNPVMVIPIVTFFVLPLLIFTAILRKKRPVLFSFFKPYFIFMLINLVFITAYSIFGISELGAGVYTIFIIYYGVRKTKVLFLTGLFLVANVSVIASIYYGKTWIYAIAVVLYTLLLVIVGYSLRKISKKPTANDFYNSREWRELRYRVIRDNKPLRCKACESEKGPFHVDHILPRSKYPERALDYTNLQVLCEDCNKGKSNIYEDDWREAN